ncbi:MAG: TonB C-terminal domain-containing protein [Gemmatimonadetes bacterium]|nr:TonB C-terminal domain-containing protein [Gemmatimonadota bacterium]
MRRSGFARRQQWKKRRGQGGGAIASTATVMVHGAVVLALVFSRAGPQRAAPPVYRVELVAAPAPEPGARKAPEVVERPAAAPAVVPKKIPPSRTSVAKTPPPPNPKNVQREPAPRTTATELAPGVKPSTGTDVATVSTSGVDFPYPEYLRNVVAQVYRRWQRPSENLSLRAEVLFLIHRDGTVTGLQFIRRSGSFAFDLEAQGAVEAAANSGAFGRLPEGYEADVLPVSFFFDPQTVR